MPDIEVDVHDKTSETPAEEQVKERVEDVLARQNDQEEPPAVQVYNPKVSVCSPGELWQLRGKELGGLAACCCVGASERSEPAVHPSLILGPRSTKQDVGDMGRSVLDRSHTDSQTGHPRNYGWRSMASRAHGC